MEEERGTIEPSVDLIVEKAEILSNSVSQGLNTMNSHLGNIEGILASIEGKQGMQGVNMQLAEIKTELRRLTNPF